MAKKAYGSWRDSPVCQCDSLSSHVLPLLQLRSRWRASITVYTENMTIHIGIQPNKLAESRLIVNLLFSQLINVNTKELPQNNKALKHQCLLLMDEFTSIGKVNIIAGAVSYTAG